MAAAVDIPFLSSHYSVPDTTLTTLTQNPTIELVNELLTSITAKAREDGNLKSDKLRLEVELETAIRTSDSKVKVLKNNAQKHLAEVSNLRNKLQEAGKYSSNHLFFFFFCTAPRRVLPYCLANTPITEETARSSLQTELDAIKSSASSGQSELSSLKSRIASLEASNRDTLGLLESKSSSYDKLAEDLSAEHKKVIDLRREVSTLEQKAQAAESAASSTRFREQNLQHELELVKKNNDWFENELKTKSTEYSKYRREKSARIAELQRELDDAKSTIDSLQRSENSLKARLDDLDQKYEGSLTTIQQLKEEAIQSSEQFRIELDSATRLAQLQGSSAETAKKRVHQLQVDFDKFKDDAAAEIARLRAEIETEHTDKEEAERRVAELELQIRNLEAEATTAARSMDSNAPMTPLRPGTPAGSFSPRASRGKGSLTLTQMYSEYDKMKTLLVAEQRNNRELKATLDEMVQDLEQSKPEIDELRSDHARLENAVMEMSQILDVAGKERDEATRESRRWQGQVEGLQQEGNILRQQLRDLSCQVKVLVMEVHLLSSDEKEYDRAELEAIAQKELDDNMEGLNNTGRFITRHLTTFKNLHELQEQNVTLRRMLRDIGDKMESEEAKQKDLSYQRDQEELKELRVRVQTFKQEMANLVAQTNSYIKERDTFRSMLMRRRETGESSAPFSQSLPLGAAPPSAQAPDHSASVAEVPDYADLLRKVQAHFDSFRQETVTDHSALKQQVTDLTRKNSELQSEISRVSSQLAAAIQRAELLQSNFGLLKSENTELKNRYTAIAENASKQDLLTQQVAEDLVEAQGTAESLRREISNLKAEKDLWKSIEKRLTEDNESLRGDRTRLDSLNASLQSMLNEREHTDAESIRRLQTNVDSLDSELQATKRRLNEESEETKKAVMRREFEQEQSQKRISDLMTSLTSTREELIAAKTTRDHLQSRVDELVVELKSAEERLETLQQKPSATTTSQPEGSATAENNPESGGLSREQELSLELAEHKRDLELTRAELAHAKEQVDDFKAISQQSEERLQELSETNEQYRADTDRLLEEKNAKITELERRIAEISSELNTTNSELSRLRDQEHEAERKFTEQKSLLESEIQRLKAEEERFQSASKCYEQDLKAQADIAQTAQQNYENELLKHAEAAKHLQEARADANRLKLEAVDLKTQAENAKLSLAQQEESWTEMKVRFESEITELGRRRDEVLNQNALLHQQLEGITKQISSLQKDRASLEEESEATGTESESSLEAMQEIIKYLRREKEIVDVQLHLSAQEAKRLRQQLDHTQSQLDETRLKLEQQRRAEADTEYTSLNHNKLVDALNELNVFRESNAALRAQLKTAEASFNQKSSKVEELQQQLEPLETRARELEGIVETKDGELKLLQEDRDRWQQRTQNILHKYDRVDPAEMEALNEKLASLEKERDEAVSAKNEVQNQVTSLETKLAEAEQKSTEAEQRLEILRSKLTEQFKARSKDLTAKLNAKQAELIQSLQEKTGVQQELDKANEELSLLRTQAQTGAGDSAPPAAVTQPASQPESQGAPAAESETQTETSQATGIDVDARVQELEKKVQELENALAAKNAEVEQKVKERTDKFKELCNAKLHEMKTSHQEEIDRIVASHKSQLEAASSSLDLGSITDAQARELCSKNATIRTILKNNIQNAINKHKESAAKATQNQPQQEQPVQTPQSAPPVQQTASAADAETIKHLEEKFAAEKNALLQEREQKIQSAVELAEKKWLAKFSMSDTRARNAQAKVEVVQKAATDTPQKP
ncbi:hypothetical protein KEM56_000199, partial [Ascosphaera pollenicola]